MNCEMSKQTITLADILVYSGRQDDGRRRPKGAAHALQAAVHFLPLLRVPPLSACNVVATPALLRNCSGLSTFYGKYLSLLSWIRRPGIFKRATSALKSSNEVSSEILI
jgi:hypothetical protein